LHISDVPDACLRVSSLQPFLNCPDFKELHAVFKHVDAYAGDPILSLMETFKADPRADKVNLSIGLYYDEAGVVPQLAAVAEVEKRMAGQPHEASLYLPMEGLAAYRQAIQALLFGAITRP
jgi:aromatic-amino-acid transaminase